jgi:hypothetical protein
MELEDRGAVFLVKRPRITGKHDAPMRKSIVPQLTLVPQIVDHPHARELARISEILDNIPQAAELVARDLEGRRRRREQAERE